MFSARSAGSTLQQERRMSGNFVYHVTRAYSGWIVQLEGEGASGSAYSDKGTALRFGQELARQAHGQLVIHREDGSVQAEHRY
jgi:hypothetical protein